MSTPRVSSLRLTAKNTLLGAIEAIPAERKIVLLDRTTVKVVDAVCTVNDILDAGVYLVETVEKKRQPYPTMDAVYFVSAEQGSKSSSSIISSDFSGKTPMYKSVHLFFTNEVPQSLFQMLATCPAGPLVKSFQEMFLEFIPFEARAFHLNMPDSFGKLLKSGSESMPANIAELEIMASRLVSLIISMNEIPTIKYRSVGGVAPDREGKLSARLANLVQEGLDHYSSRNPNFKPVPGGDFIILDRTVDLVAPLLHEFTYQAMAQDLLPIHHENRYDYKFSSGTSGEATTRTVALDENDSLWLEMRHTHIADCSKFIVNRFNQFMSENKAAVKQNSKSKSAETGGNVSSMAEMKDAINALGEFQELKSQYSLHFTIAEECLSVFNKKKLVEIAGVEQNMVMGVDPEGKVVKDIWKQMTPLLGRDNLSSEDRVRLIMIYLLTQPTLNEADRKSMLDHAKLSPSDLESLRRLMLLCGDTNVMAPKIKKKAEDYNYEVSRYAPRIKAILSDSVAGVLDTSSFSTVKGSNLGNSSAPSSAKAAPVSLRQKTAASNPMSAPNSASTSSSVPSRSVVVFVIGGVTYSEIRSAYEVAEATKREVYIVRTLLSKICEQYNETCKTKMSINKMVFIHQGSNCSTTITFMDLSTFITEEDVAFEEDLLVNPYDMRTWQRYLESKRLFLLGQGEHVTSPIGSDKMAFLYERVCKLLPGSFKLWKEYLDLLRESSKHTEIIIGAFERALNSLHRMPRIWLDYMEFLLQSKEFKKVRPVFNRALQALPITQHSRLWDFIFAWFIRRFGSNLPNWSKSFWERYLQIAPEKRTDYIKFLKKIGDWDTAARELVTLANSLMKSTNDLVKDEKKVQVRRPKEQESESDSEDEDDEVDLNVQKCWDSLCQLVMEHSHEIVSVSVDSILRTAISVFKRDQGRYWTALATYHIRRGYFDSARLVFEEAMEKVFLVRDFAQIFDSYAKMEETILEISIEDAVKTSKKSKKKNQENNPANTVSAYILIQMKNLRSLLERHGFLLNDVLLRQNPHSVTDWLDRIKLVRQASNDQVEAVMQAFEDALRTINPRKVAVNQIWTELAAFLESKEAYDSARQVFQRACEWGQVDFGSADDAASVFIAAAEFEFRRGAVQDGLEIISSALSPGRKRTGNEAWDSLGKSLRLWNFLIDSEEARGATGACEAAYERLLQLRLAQPQHIINYALFREELLDDLDGAFKIYERGIELFNYPIAFEIWNIYLPKFVKKYASTRLERTRDLFESALQGCPEKFAMQLFLMYGKVEEEYGLLRNALAIYRRACGVVAANDRPVLYNLLISKTIESQGAFSARPIYEEAIKSLPFPASLPFALAHSALEEKLNEIPRARALLVHMAQFCDPRAYEQTFWKPWQEFETRNGDEASFREMLRIKRSVSNLFLQKLPFVKASEAVELENDNQNEQAAKEQNEEEMELDL